MKYLLILCILFCGCGERKPKTLYGMIFKKIYKPAWTEHYTSVDSDGNVSFHSKDHPEEFYFIVHEHGGEDQMVITNKQEFKRLELGRTWYNAGAILEK